MKGLRAITKVTKSLPLPTAPADKAGKKPDEAERSQLPSP